MKKYLIIIQQKLNKTLTQTNIPTESETCHHSACLAQTVLTIDIYNFPAEF